LLSSSPKLSKPSKPSEEDIAALGYADLNTSTGAKQTNKPLKTNVIVGSSTSPKPKKKSSKPRPIVTENEVRNKLTNKQIPKKKQAKQKPQTNKQTNRNQFPFQFKKDINTKI
jgi:hypothetical protein